MGKRDEFQGDASDEQEELIGHLRSGFRRSLQLLSNIIGNLPKFHSDELSKLATLFTTRSRFL